MYAVKKVELQRLVVLAKSPVNSPGKVFTTADGENNWNNTNTNTGNDTSLNKKSQSKHEQDQVYCAWLKKGLLCLYILEKVDIWSGDTDAS